MILVHVAVAESGSATCAVTEQGRVVGVSHSIKHQLNQAVISRVGDISENCENRL